MLGFVISKIWSLYSPNYSAKSSIRNDAISSSKKYLEKRIKIGAKTLTKTHARVLQNEYSTTVF